eukprot:5825355-Pyramimonas_sp.AAC.2
MNVVPFYLNEATDGVDLRNELFGHGASVALVLGVHLFSEGPPWRVKHHRDGAVRVLPHELLDGVDHPLHGSSGLPTHGRQLRHRVEGAVQIVRAVHEYEVRGSR